MVGLVQHRVRLFITEVSRARDAVIEHGDVARDAPLIEVTGLNAITPEVIETQAVIRLMNNLVQVLITGIDGALEAIAQDGRLALNAAGREIAELVSCTIQPIVTNGVIGKRRQLLSVFIADGDHTIGDTGGLRRNTG